MGRPSKYKKEYAEQIYKLCLLGLTDKQIADLWDVKEQTINNWKKKYPEFFESIKKGKEIADADVAVALYKKACGYTYTETKNNTQVSIDAGGEKEIEITHHFPPDTAAAFIWLKNRQPNIWRDNPVLTDDSMPAPESITVTIVDGRKPKAE